MASLVTFNGKNFILPESGEKNWGAAVSAFLQEVASAALAKASGSSFSLTADVDFGPFGIKAAKGYFDAIDRRLANGSLVIRGDAQAAGTPALKIDNMTAPSDSWKILSVFGTGGTEKAVIRGSGRYDYINIGDSTGAPGAATLNTPAGLSAFANGTGVAGIVITNNLVNANSRINAMMQTLDAGAWIKAVVPAAGSFTVYTNINTAGIRNFAWWVTNGA